jgi:hypothetical protein
MVFILAAWRRRRRERRGEEEDGKEGRWWKRCGELDRL